MAGKATPTKKPSKASSESGKEGKSSKSIPEVSSSTISKSKASKSSFPLAPGRREEAVKLTWGALFYGMLLLAVTIWLLWFCAVPLSVLCMYKILDLPRLLPLPVGLLVKGKMDALVNAYGEEALRGVLYTRTAQLANVFFYFLNVFCVSLGGRVDSRYQETNGVPEYDEYRGLITPAKWAFLIWPVIFAGEFAFVALQLLPWGRDAPWLRNLTPWFCFACLCQALWCFSFRVWARATGVFWISAVHLSGIAAGLYMCQTAMLSAHDLSLAQYALVHVPLSLHFAWVTAAALVNWNTYFALLVRDGKASPAMALLLANLSLYAATAIGVVLTTLRADIAFGMGIVWALTAVKAYARANLREAHGGTNDVAMGALALTASLGAAAVFLSALFTALLMLNFYYAKIGHPAT